MKRQSQPARWPILLAAIALACSIWTVFRPVLGFEFVDYDVGRQVKTNRYIRGLTAENLKHIFTSRCVSSYYPVRTLTFAIDYQFWGLDPAGFELTNVLIHLANVLLVFWLILRLLPRVPLAVPVPGRPRVPLALPVPGRPRVAPAVPRVAPAVPVSGRATTGPQNALAQPVPPDGALAQPAAPGGAGWDAWAAGFSAGVFALHPVVVEPVAWVSGREELLMTLGALGCLHFHLAARRLSDAAARSRRATACHACAALCCAAACLSNAVGAAIPLLVGALDALTLAGPKFRRILWGSSALWAISLATIVGKKMTPETELAVSQPLVFLDRLLLILNVYWLNLKTLLWPTKLAVQYTAITPRTLAIAEAVLGAFAVGVSFAGLWLLRRRKLTLFGLLWFCLALAPVSQIMPHHIQRADRFLYLPLAGLAAAAAMEVRRLPGVLTERVAVGGTVVAGALGLLLLAILSSGQVQTWRNSLCMWQNCLRVSPDCAVAHAGYADNLAQRGQYAEAIRHYEQAVWRDPKNHEILRGFALLLATCPVETLRDCELAARLANQACRLDKRGDLATVAVLAEVNAQAGRLEMAVAATKKAIAIAQANGEREIAEDLRRRLSLLQNAAAPPRTGK